MLLQNIILASICVDLSVGIVYDYYTAKPLTDSQLSCYEAQGLIDTCTINIEPCNENERRRIDGSCNNLENPARGTYFSPPVRILPPVYYNGSFQRKAASGNELTLARTVRVNLLKQGKSSHYIFNQNIPGYCAFLFNDIGSIHDIQNTIAYTTYCCEEEHMNDYKCTPNIVPDDDSVFRFTSIRCMNSTRPLTYQGYNCTQDPVPTPIQKATSQFDLSQIYNVYNEGDSVIRSYYKGELSVEIEDNKIFPPNGPNASCPNNVGTETRCFQNYLNSNVPVNLFTVWFVRYHNYVASQLAEVNPCWDDEKLFYVARDIVIATSQQLYLYEWMPAVQGRENVIKAGLMVEDGGFRDLYDKKNHPIITLEYIYLTRWFHLLQVSTAKLYDRYGDFRENYPLLNASFKMGMLAQHNNMEYFGQSTFREPCHGTDGSISEDMANRGLPGVQLAIDVAAGDLNKGRNFGIPPYLAYVRHFTNLTINSFDDLAVLIPKDKIRIMQDTYETEEDIDLLAALWVEKPMEGGHIPLILAHIINDNMLRAISSDRHWFERPNRPYAFTTAQLGEIRKITLAWIMCTVADGVIEIPVNAFLNIGPENPLVSCSEIKKMDFRAWTDESCNTSDS